MFTARLSEFVCETPHSAIPHEVTRRVATALIDTVGVGLAGSREDVVDVALSQVAAFGGQGAAQIIGYDLTTNAPDAAFVNAVAIHILDFDDSLPTLRGHPSGPVLAAALAAASLEKTSGEEFLASYALGVEVAGKIGRVLGHGHYFRGWHTTATVGVFSATAAAGRVLGLDARQMALAFGLAAAGSAGLLKSFGTMGKSFQVGQAARNGMMAAWLAREGATASSTVFDGDDGFFGTYAMGDGASAVEIARGIGQDWEAQKPGISFKRWPCCYGSHRTISGMLELVAQHGIRAGDVVSIEIGFGPKGDKALTSTRPRSGLEAKFSVEYPCAAVLLDGGISFASFDDGQVNRPEAQSLIGLTRRVAMAGEGVFTAHSGYNDITIRTTNGDFSTRASLTPGSPALPMSADDLRAKFLDCAVIAQEPQSATDLFTALSDIRQAEDVSAVFSAQRRHWHKSPPCFGDLENPKGRKGRFRDE